MEPAVVSALQRAVVALCKSGPNQRPAGQEPYTLDEMPAEAKAMIVLYGQVRQLSIAYQRGQATEAEVLTALRAARDRLDVALRPLEERTRLQAVKEQLVTAAEECRQAIDTRPLRGP